MNEKIVAGPLSGNNSHEEIKEAVCIHTDKVYDSCKDKDCIEDARVFLTASSQELVDKAVNVKCRKSEIIWVFSDVAQNKPIKNEAAKMPPRFLSAARTMRP